MVHTFSISFVVYLKATMLYINAYILNSGTHIWVIEQWEQKAFFSHFVSIVLESQGATVSEVDEVLSRRSISPGPPWRLATVWKDVVELLLFRKLHFQKTSVHLNKNVPVMKECNLENVWII